MSEEKYTIDYDVLFGGNFDAAMGELAKLVYKVAEHHNVGYVTATAFMDGDNESLAYGQRRDGEFTGTVTYKPQEGEANEH